MDIGPWPRISNASLRNSLRMAEVLADVARQVTDPPLHRLLLAASCRILDGALTAAMETEDPGDGRDLPIRRHP